MLTKNASYVNKQKHMQGHKYNNLCRNIKGSVPDLMKINASIVRSASNIDLHLEIEKEDRF